jgi:DNA-binding IclR family transcriptional regulator
VSPGDLARLVEAVAVLDEPGHHIVWAVSDNTRGWLSLDAGKAIGFRQRGYALEREQNTLGIGCIGVPVPYRIPATDAISCSIPIARCTEKEVARVAAIIRDHVQQLATTLRSEGIR